MTSFNFRILHNHLSNRHTCIRVQMLTNHILIFCLLRWLKSPCVANIHHESQVAVKRQSDVITALTYSWELFRIGKFSDRFCIYPPFRRKDKPVAEETLKIILMLGKILILQTIYNFKVNINVTFSHNTCDDSAIPGRYYHPLYCTPYR